MFEHLDPERVHAVVFSTRPQGREDEISARIAKVTTWRRVDGLSDEDLARAIRAAGVEILFDLSGHTAGHRLGVFARKTAPIQIRRPLPALAGFLAGVMERAPGSGRGPRGAWARRVRCTDELPRDRDRSRP